MSRFPTSACRAIVTGLNHPECVAIGSDGTLFTGGEAGEIYRISADGSEVTVFAQMGADSGGIALDADGNLYECNASAHLNRIAPDGTSSVYSTGAPDLPTVYPNYPVFDAAGNLYFSDSGDWSKLNGRIYVVRPSGTTEVTVPDYLAFPNGLAYDTEDGWLYIVQSSARNVVRVKVSDGEALDRPELYAEFSQGTVPDGVALSESGNLYVACYEPNVIYVVEPDGRVDVVVEGLAFGLLNRPTNVTFARDAPDIYYPNYGTGEIVRLTVGERGLPLNYPHLQPG